MNRRGFIRGLVAVPVAATVGAALPRDGVLIHKGNNRLKLYDSEPCDYVELRHDGTDCKLYYVRESDGKIACVP